MTTITIPRDLFKRANSAAIKLSGKHTRMFLHAYAHIKEDGK